MSDSGNGGMMKRWKEERAERVEGRQCAGLSLPTPGGDYRE